MGNLMKYKHLNQDTNNIMDKSLSEKIHWARINHFIFHEKAQRSLDELERIYAAINEDNNFFDKIGLSIIGNSGTGKTSIFEQFVKQHPVENRISYQEIPVAYCLLKDSVTGTDGLYSSILGAFNHPFGNPKINILQRLKNEDLKDLIIYLMKETHVRIFFLDEFQHLKGKNKTVLLSEIKEIMMASKVCFIPVGMPTCEAIIHSDDDLSRIWLIQDFSKLDFWTLEDKDSTSRFRDFLSKYEQFLPLPEPSYLSSPSISSIIFEKIEKINGKKTGLTNLRQITRFLKEVSVKALESNVNSITEAIINETNYECASDSPTTQCE